MAAIEVIHFMQTKTRGTDMYVALKLDISKAYDRMDWEYLREVMVKMGFSNKWFHWISMCIELVDYSVIANNEPVGPIIPGRGLRQGDPLSPYLLLCAQKVSLCSLGMRRIEAQFLELEFAEELLLYLTFYLLMIVFYVSEQMKVKLTS